jgi:hypothetical protein
LKNVKIKANAVEFSDYRHSDNLQAATSGAYSTAPSILPKLTNQKSRTAIELRVPSVDVVLS